jgi:hypothetical protein
MREKTAKIQWVNARAAPAGTAPHPARSGPAGTGVLASARDLQADRRLHRSRSRPAGGRGRLLLQGICKRTGASTDREADLPGGGACLLLQGICKRTGASTDREAGLPGEGGLLLQGICKRTGASADREADLSGEGALASARDLQADRRLHRSRSGPAGGGGACFCKGSASGPAPPRIAKRTCRGGHACFCKGSASGRHPGAVCQVRHAWICAAGIQQSAPARRATTFRYRCAIVEWS